MGRGRSGMDAVKRIMRLIANGDGDGEGFCSIVVVFLRCPYGGYKFLCTE